MTVFKINIGCKVQKQPEMGYVLTGLKQAY